MKFTAVKFPHCAYRVTLRVRVWIEIITQNGKVAAGEVTLRVRVWIEIF